MGESDVICLMKWCYETALSYFVFGLFKALQKLIFRNVAGQIGNLGTVTLVLFLKQDTVMGTFTVMGNLCELE